MFLNICTSHFANVLTYKVCMIVFVIRKLTSRIIIKAGNNIKPCIKQTTG